MSDILDCHGDLPGKTGKISIIELPKVPIEVHKHILDHGGTVILTYEVTEIDKANN